MSPQIPTVSVLMPVHNGQSYLTEALDDLLAQTFRDFELVVVDDGSTDDTLTILNTYASHDERVVVLRNETNIGLPRALNCGLERCQGELVARADADDRYLHDRLERQVRFMRANPDVGLLSCAAHKMSASGHHYRAVYFPTEDGCIKIRELFVNSFSHPGVMFDRHLVEAVGGYDPTYWAAEDADLWARLRPHTKMANLPVPLVHYRTHSTSFMRTRGSEGEALSLSVRQRLLSQYLERPLDIDETRSIVALYRGNQDPNRSEINVGRAGLREVLQRAELQEEPETVRFYRREVARSLLQQAISWRDADRSLSWMLFKDAIWWDPWCPARQAVRHGLSLVYRALFSEDILICGSVRNIIPHLAFDHGCPDRGRWTES